MTHIWKNMFCMAAAAILPMGAASAAENVLDFTGSASYVAVGTPTALQILSGPFTVEGWVRFDNIGITRCFYSKCNARTGTRYYTYMFGVGAGGANMVACEGFYAAGGKRNTWRLVPLSPAIETGRWYHLAFSLVGGTMSFYLDGELQGTQPYTFGNRAGDPVTIGGYANTTDVDGHLSDMRVWNHARSQAAIQALMNRRLNGAETGLLGYWPMNEGSGSEVYDGTANASTGTVVNATWTTSDLELSARPSDFAYASAFTLADIETGSERFTNTNEVELAQFTIPDGYDRFQVTEEGVASSLGAWVPTNDAPGYRVVFTQPAGDTNVALYAWFTNSAASVTLFRSEGAIVFTTNTPVAVVLADATSELIPGSHVEIRPEDVDNGSTGGEALGEAMEIHSWRVNLVSGPDTNATPDEPYVTVAKTGDYTLTLTIVNEAGNTATSSACVLSVTPFSGRLIWSGLGDGTDWFDPQNWIPVGQPADGHAVRIDEGAAVLLTNATAMLSELLLTNATLTVSNWNTAIRADTVTIDDGGVLTLPGPFNDTDMSNRVYIVCTNFTLAEGGTINANGKGYAGACGPSGAGTSSRLSGAGYGGRGKMG